MKIKFFKFFRDITAVFCAELRNSLTDAGTILLFIVAVIAYPVLYSIGYLNETLRDVPVAVVDLDQTVTSRRFARLTDATEQIKVKTKPESLKEAEQLFFRNEINGVILIPENFEKDIFGKKTAKISVYCDASRFLIYKQVLQGTITGTTVFSAGIEYRQLMAGGKMPEQAYVQTDPLHAEVFNLFNPSSAYATFIVPGILLIVIQQSLLVGIGILSGKKNDHRNKNSIQFNHVSGANAVSEIIGKSASYVFIYLFTSLFLLGCLYRWLSFPEKGTLISIYIILIPYLFSISFAGLALGSLFNKRVSALMYLVFLSPAVFFFTGISWPLQLMPGFVRSISYLFPSSFALPAFVKLRIMGAGPESITREWSYLMIQTTIYFLMACMLQWFSKKQNEPFSESEITI